MSLFLQGTSVPRSALALCPHANAQDIKFERGHLLFHVLAGEEVYYGRIEAIPIAVTTTKKWFWHRIKSERRISFALQ
jgi:hypothetical protein